MPIGHLPLACYWADKIDGDNWANKTDKANINWLTKKEGVS